MKRLIKSEFIKLFKIKIHLLLIVLLTLSTIIITYISFKDYGKLYDDLKYYENFSGERIDSIGAAQIVDETLHQYAGQWSESTYQQIKEDYLKLIKKYPRTVIDDEAMRKVYGDNYKVIMYKSLAGTLKAEEFEDYMSHIETGRGYGIMTDATGRSYIHLYYQEDGIQNLLSLIYTSPYIMVETRSPDQSFDDMWSGYDETIRNGEQYIELLSSYGQFDSHQSVLKDYLISKAKDLPQTFDSTVPNNLFINALEKILLAPLFIVIILLANIFGIEKQNHMEEIIYPTVSSKRQITIAKLIVGTCVGVGVVWLQLLVCFLVSSIILPIHTWDIVLMDMASSHIASISSYIPYTYATVMFYCLILTIVGSMVVSLMTLGVSYFIKSRFVVLISMTILLVVSGFIKQITIIPALLKAFMPLNLLSFLDYFYGYTTEMSYPYFIFNNMVIPYRHIVIVAWGIISIIMIWILVKHSHDPAMSK